MEPSLERAVMPLPEIKLTFDCDKQVVDIKFAPEDFKTWEWVIACLDMAKSKACHHRDLQLQQQAMAEAQRAYAAQQRAAQLHKQIIG